MRKNYLGKVNKPLGSAHRHSSGSARYLLFGFGETVVDAKHDLQSHIDNDYTYGNKYREFVGVESVRVFRDGEKKRFRAEAVIIFDIRKGKG